MRPVLKAASYLLVHTPDMIVNNGTTATTEKIVNPDSDFLKNVEAHIRPWEDVINYAPNQVYIGNMDPEALRDIEEPWCQHPVEGQREGRHGSIVPQDEFMAMMKVSDAFDLVSLSKEFVAHVKPILADNPLYNEADIAALKEGTELELIEKSIAEEHSEPLFHDKKVIGCVKRGHDVDVNLTAHVLLENLVVKASGILAARELFLKSGINPEEVEYVIECSEEACGDMNQRGGGNFAKAIAELAGMQNATGSDTRGFCAAPTHSLIQAGALVAAKTFKNVLVVAGGATAKLGMNGKDHVKKGLPVLEDVLGGFAVLVSEDDGVSPVLNTEVIGKHTVKTGSSPQAVISSLVTAPLDQAGLKITDVDKFATEMQNPDITKPAGAGDVPVANYKMIAALGVKRGDIEKAAMNDFIIQRGVPGYAPTQGHIPSGVPIIGHAIDEIKDGNWNRVMIVGKGSLFLGRMTNLFDGVSFIMEANDGKGGQAAGDSSMDETKVKSLIADAMRKLAESLAEEE